LNILLLDDDLDSLESLSVALDSKGYLRREFSDPETAVEAYRSGEFDVVITDFRMPRMNGIEVLRTIRGIDPEAYVIIITAYADTENAIAAVNYGAYAFLCKPLDIKSLLHTLHRIESKMKIEKGK